MAGLVGSAPPLGPDPDPDLDPDPMLGQFLVEPEDEVPLELLGGVVLADPEEFVDEPLPVDELVPDPLVPVELVELVVGVLVAALAANAPPVMRPPVSAPIARALRKWSFTVCFLSRWWNFAASSREGTPSVCDIDLWAGREARHSAIGVCRRLRGNKRPVSTRAPRECFEPTGAPAGAPAVAPTSLARSSR